ncbi:threonine synthase [Paenibacillus sp. HJGM_3]|uniref:threonine synthase n=1 Tax=Paenibacillus sp. HJGM_3 TaxID=3379816 RepID=UPI00385A4571
MQVQEQGQSHPLQCSCGGLYDVELDVRGLDAERLKRLFDARLAERMTPYASGVWRYKELIDPELPLESIVTKYEGNTGLYAPESVAKYAGVRRLLLKAQSENPSGSFKDNGMTAAVSRGMAEGHRRFVCTSTGNTSASLAMYAAMAGAEAVVLLPDAHVAAGKLYQTRAYGARVVSLTGAGYDAGIASLLRGEAGGGATGACATGACVVNSINPWRIEGQKSIVYELAHTLGWTLPDWIVVPGGALSNATALGKGLRDLYALGFIDRLPRVAVVQAEGAAPFHRLVAALGAQADREEFAPAAPAPVPVPELGLEPELHPHTVASALNIGYPPSWKKALHYAIRGTNGVTACVSDADILAAKAVIDRSGIGCEPASAATVAGLRQLVASGTIHPDETAACILTGHLLKDHSAS